MYSDKFMLAGYCGRCKTGWEMGGDCWVGPRCGVQAFRNAMVDDVGGSGTRSKESREDVKAQIGEQGNDLWMVGVCRGGGVIRRGLGMRLVWVVDRVGGCNVSGWG